VPRTQTAVIKLKTAFEIAFSPAEDHVAFFGARDVSVLSLPASTRLFSVHPIAYPSHIDFSPDGSRLVVKSTSGRAIILNARTGETLLDFRNQKEGEGSAALFSSCGRYVVSVSWHGLFSVRNGASGELVFSDVTKECMLNDLSAPCDRRFFVHSIGHRPPSDSEPPPPETVVLQPWPIERNNRRELPQRWSFIGALQVSPSGRLLAVIHGAPPKTLDVYDIERSQIVASRSVPSGGTGCSIGWSSDERLLGISVADRCLVLETPKLTVRHELALRYACHVSFSPSSRLLALGSWSTSFIVPLGELATFAQSRQVDA
jgi:WD40 repeat protein